MGAQSCTDPGRVGYETFVDVAQTQEPTDLGLVDWGFETFDISCILRGQPELSWVYDISQVVAAVREEAALADL